MKINPQSLALGMIGLSLSVCTDSGHLSVTSSTDAAQETGDEMGEISLVSLVLPYTGDLGSPRTVVDGITGIPIPYCYAVWERNVVVTLQLPKGVLANPELSFGGGAVFAAWLSPDHSLSTYDNLEFGHDAVVLRDHGVELKLDEGVPTIIAPGDLVSIWTGESLEKGARVGFTSRKAGDYGLSLEPTGEMVVKQQTRLLTRSESLKLGDHESICVVVTPTDTTEAMPLSLSVVGR